MPEWSLTIQASTELKRSDYSVQIEIGSVKEHHESDSQPWRLFAQTEKVHCTTVTVLERVQCLPLLTKYVEGSTTARSTPTLRIYSADLIFQSYAPSKSRCMVCRFSSRSIGPIHYTTVA